MKEYSRSDRKLLSQLSSLAYERELGQALGQLGGEFDRWRRSELSPFALTAQVHEFHDGVARELYVVYTRFKPASAVARAVAREILHRSELPAGLLDSLKSAIEFYASEPADALGDE